jgi:hypothetical protein
MKKLFIAFAIVAVSASVAQAQDLRPSKPTPSAPQAPVPPPPPPAASIVNPNAGKFEFKEETHDFGEIPEGPLAEFDFEFKNVGKEPIIIQEAHGSCGCTVPKWPQEPILPGKTAAIHVAYNSQGRPGPINKDITINSNAQQSPMVLHIRGTVKPKNPAPPKD